MKETGIHWHERRDLRTPIYYWFADGFDTADPKKAKALLGELVAS
jgi:hypothetical protein